MKKYCMIFYLVTLSSSAFAQSGSAVYLTGSVNDICMNPVFSSDGNKIAYTKASYKGLWIFDRVTNSIRQLTDEDATGFAFKWSSDSKSILTRVAKYENLKRYNAVKIFENESGEAKVLTDYKTIMPYLPDWVNDDAEVFLPTKDGVEVYSTGKLAKTNMLAAELSCYLKNDKIVVRNFLTGVEQTISPIENVNIINLITSPDKNRLAFEVVGGNLYSMNIDGSNLTDLGKGNRPRWSFDSRKIIYMIAEDDGHTFTASDIFCINADGTQKKNLTNTDDLIELNPCFAPDGKSFVFDVYNDGSIYLMNIEYWGKEK
jgi:Tol biopolymer transport system component